jgi:hypothetical protein
MKHRLILTMQMLMLVFFSYEAIAASMISIGYEQTSGSYGLADDTDIKTLPVTAQYIDNVWRFRVSVPHIAVTGNGSVIPGSSGSGGGNGFGGMQSQLSSLTETESGLGDITSSVSYSFLPERNQYMFYELTGEIKWGTASVSKSLGTGENDFSLDLFSTYEKHDVKPFISIGYLMMGDTDIVNYKNVFFTMAGLMYQMNPQTQFSLAYDYQQATRDGSNAGELVKFYVTRQFDKKWTANIYLLNGLSDSVAESGVGFTLMRNF